MEKQIGIGTCKNNAIDNTCMNLKRDWIVCLSVKSNAFPICGDPTFPPNLPAYGVCQFVL